MKPSPWPLLILLVLASCANGESAATARPPAPSATPLPPALAALPENATTAARIHARGALVVGIRYDLQPFGYITDAGAVAGFDVDLGHEFASRWLGDAQAVEFRQVRSDTAVEHLQAGDIDIAIAALTHSHDREAGADFGQTIFVDGQALLVRAADAGAISGPMSLQGRPVGIASWEAEDALWAAVPFTPTLVSYDRFNLAVEGLSQGEIDAVADLRCRLFWGRRLFPETAVVGPYTSVPVALAFAQDDPFFADLVNLTFQDMVADGTYADLYARWFAPDQPPDIELWPGQERPSLVDAPIISSAPDTIASISARGRLSVAVAGSRPPFAYTDAAGLPAGYEVNLVQLLAERWLGNGTAASFFVTTADAGEEMLRTGQADLMIGAVAHTRAAEMVVDFSPTVYLAGEGLLVQAGSAITGVTSLNGQQVAVVDGGGSREILLAAAQDAGVSLTVMPQPTLEGAITLLQEGQVVAVAGERADLLGPVYATRGLDVLPLRLTEVPLALALPPGDSTFRDLVHLTFQTMETEGQFDALYTTWFDDTPPAMEIWPGAPYQSLRLSAGS